MNALRRHHRAHRADDRGAAFIEFALVLPFLILIALGIVNYGINWTSTNEVNATARDAARSASSSGSYYNADLMAIQQVAMGLTQVQVDHLDRVVIYDASVNNGKVPPSCLTTSTANSSIPLGVSGVCNVYNYGQIEAYRIQLNRSGGTPDASLTVTFNMDKNHKCGAGGGTQTWDAKWCPTSRRNDMDTNNLTYIGVYIRIKQPDVTHFGFGDQTISRSAVFRLEPEAKY